jgi:hypothetical protein
MSVKMPIITATILLLIPVTSSAEYGKGTIEDPINREYTRGVFRDWQEGVVRHEATGNYIVTYKTVQGYFNSVVYEPATKIDPTLKSKFWIKQNQNNLISYSYRLKSKATSKQAISNLQTTTSIAHSSDVPVVRVPAPDGWVGSLSSSSSGQETILAWSSYHDANPGLLPGKNIDGFRVETSDLPGIGIMRIRGARQPATWLGHHPDLETEVGKQIDTIEENDFVSRPAAVPRIRVTSSYYGASVLDTLRVHITKDIVEMKLVDPVLAAQIDRFLQAAADAVRRDSDKAAREHLHDAMKLLKKEHPDCDQENNDKNDISDDENNKTGAIHRLVARVIAFDIKYVEKRLKK